MSYIMNNNWTHTWTNLHTKELTKKINRVLNRPGYWGPGNIEEVIFWLFNTAHTNHMTPAANRWTDGQVRVLLDFEAEMNAAKQAAALEWVRKNSKRVLMDLQPKPNQWYRFGPLTLDDLHLSAGRSMQALVKGQRHGRTRQANFQTLPPNLQQHILGTAYSPAAVRRAYANNRFKLRNA